MTKPTPLDLRVPTIVIMMAALLILFCFKGRVLVPPDVTTTLYSTGFSAQAAVNRLQRLLGDERPHPVDSEANDAVRERILNEIRLLGYKPEVRDDFACRGSKRFGGLSCARVRNIAFRSGPAGGGAALIAAHYDSVPAGPGASDDGAGVTATLEIAARLMNRKPRKPIIFLLTDGEEAGLLGAASFVRKDPWAKDVAFAINMEARGTGGPAIMFQTSSPNSREIATLQSKRLRIIANSMAADIYRILPNDTDATEFLSKGYDVLNFAFIAPLARYHTPLDNLAHLERESVGHMGGAALTALEAYLAQDSNPKEAETQVIYSDLLGRGLLVLPVAAGYLLLAFGFGAALYAYVRNGPNGPVRGLVAPLAAILVASGTGFGTLWLVDELRPESLWWFASPMAGRVLIYSCAIFGALLALWLSRGVSPARLLAGAWLWLAGLFLGISFISPGSMILVAPAATIAGLGFVLMGRRAAHDGSLRIFGLGSAIVALAFILPALDFAEVGLGFGLGWGFGALASLLMLCMLIPVWQQETRMGGISLLAMIFIAGGLIWAIFATPYTADVPRPLNVQHWHNGVGENAWVLNPGDDAAPDSMQALAPFKRGPLKNADGPRVHASAPIPTGADIPTRIEVVSERKTTDGRVLKLRVTAPGADEIILFVSKEAQVRSLKGGQDGEAGGLDFDTPMDLGLRCVGRSCAQWDLEVTLGPNPSDWITRAIVRHLGPESEALLRSRPPWASPIQGGDVRIKHQRQKV